MHARQPTSRTRGDILRALGNLTWTAAIVIGAPLLLSKFFGYPLPRQMPDWGDVFSTPMQLVEPAVFINALVCIGWITWIVVMVYVILDISDLARGVGQRARRLGPASIVAGKLVASIALLISLIRPLPGSTPISRPAAIEQIAEPPAPFAISATLIRADAPLPPTPAANPPVVSQPLVPTYVVQRGDSLWRIAEQQLGNGFRWKEIHELNKTFITNPDQICIGWTLALPDDAATLPAVSEPPSNSKDQGPDSQQTNEETPPGSTETRVVPPASATTVAPTTSTSSTEPPAAEQPAVPPPTTPATPATEAPTALDPPAAAGTTLPLSLRAQGFETQEQYRDWLAAQRTDESSADGTSAVADAARIAAGVAIPALLAAAVVTAVDRRRRRVLQHRPIHGPLPRRDPGLRQIEMAYRTQPLVDPVEQIGWIDAILRLLTIEMTAHPEEAQLLLVRPGAFGMELLWDRPPTTPCPTGFRTAEDDQTWEYPLTDHEGLRALRERVAGQPPYVQALVTLGETPEGPVLVNLEAVDELDLIGDSESTDGWVAAVALDLAAHRWAERVGRAITLSSPQQPQLTTTLRVTDDGRATPLVWQAPQAAQTAPWRFKVGPHAAVLSNTELGFTLEVAPALASNELFSLTERLLADAARDPYSGSDHEQPDDPTPPLAEPDWTASLAPDVPTVPPDTQLPLGDGVETSTHAATPSNVTLVLPQEPRDDIATDWDAGDGVVARVLGPVRTTGWQTRPKAGRTEALLIFLAMSRPAPVSTDRIIDALWNGKAVTAKTVYNAVTNLRREAGDPGIVTSSPDGYALDERVLTDWDRFVALVGRAGRESWPARRESLAAALSMVTGKPFDGAEKDYPWASTDGTISRLEVAVTDAAGQLAAEAIEQGDCAMAIWAARRALLACPWLVRMYGYIIEAHALEGDVTAIEHIWRELQRALSGDEVPSELVELYAQHRA